MNATVVKIDKKRLKALPSIAKGSHQSAEDGMCVMEMVSYVAHEPFSDRPQCVSPIISVFMRTWNDDLGDEDRNRLLAPLIPKLVGTASTPEIEDRRGWMAADWFIREMTPVWLRAAKLNQEADAIASLGEIKDIASLEACMRVLLVAKEKSAAARDAARDAAGAAAWDAAWAAAWAAARAAARDAAGAAAWDAAGAAAWAAARDAAWAAAWAALKPTVNELQASALNLIDRMCALKA